MRKERLLVFFVVTVIVTAGGGIRIRIRSRIRIGIIVCVGAGDGVSGVGGVGIASPLGIGLSFSPRGRRLGRLATTGGSSPRTLSSRGSFGGTLLLLQCPSLSLG